MPGQICAVASCSSNRINLKKEGIQLIFHSFPKVTDDEGRKEWVKRCNRDKLNPNTSTICSLHFQPSDYERDLQSELLGLPSRKVLKKTAVPTLYLDFAENSYFTRKKRKIARKKKEPPIAEFVLENPSNQDEHFYIVTKSADLTDTSTTTDTKQNFKKINVDSSNIINPLKK
ncbi:unnamed protein product [Ceutorhynchus assimilis]|uniref:THAP-type domain-containing protein n=1 Tax=Ceutorhynchus assimilis TaxID=467358 RepID=A0A9N9MFE6_9CUCU|nr:unnamed protein product [Ceutorhynchus assimilis]